VEREEEEEEDGAEGDRENGGGRREDQILIKMKRKTIKRVRKRKKLFEWVEKPRAGRNEN